jgi:hypothetical protein
MVDFSGACLSPAVYSFLLYIENHEKEGSKAKISKQARTIPNLILWMEKYEVLLIKLEKQTKVKLRAKFRRSTARDFKIEVQVLEEKSTADEEGGPPKKKSKKETTKKSDPKPKKRKVKQEDDAAVAPNTKKRNTKKKNGED